MLNPTFSTQNRGYIRYYYKALKRQFFLCVKIV